MRKILLAHIAMLTATILYGINYRIAKSVMPTPVDPTGFIMLRLIGVGVLMALLYLCFVRERIARRDYWRLFVCGFFGACLNMLLFFEGLALTSPFNSSLVMAVTPIIILLVAYFLGQESLRVRKIVGILIGLSGALLLILSKEEGASVAAQGDILGDVLVMLNGVAYGVYISMVKPLLQRYHPVTLLTWIFLFGMLSTFPVGWQSLTSISFINLEAWHWGAILFVVFGSTALTYWLNITSLRYVQASMVGYYIYVQPICALILDGIMGYGYPSRWQLFAGALVFTGIYIVNKNPKQRVKTQEQ